MFHYNLNIPPIGGYYEKTIRSIFLILIVTVFAVVMLSGCGVFGKNKAVGIEKIEKSGSEGLVDTYTITLTNGETSTFTVTNGKDGINADGSSADPNAPTPDKYFRFELLENDTYRVRYAYYDMPERVVIPETYKGKAVTVIYDFGSFSIQAIVIHKNITSIRNSLYECEHLQDIYYKGTKAEWDAIQKGEYWDGDTGDYILHCTDGDFAKGE